MVQSKQYTSTSKPKEMEKNKQELTGWEDMFSPSSEPVFLDKDNKPVQMPRLPVKTESLKLTTEEVVEKFGEELAEKQLTLLTKTELKTNLFDRYGLCPHCKSNFDGGDIFEQLCQKEVLTLQGEAKKIASMYGWTEHNKKRFSSVIDHEIEDKMYHECPFCKHVFENETSIEYESLLDLKMKRFKEVYKMPEIDEEANELGDAPF